MRLFPDGPGCLSSFGKVNIDGIAVSLRATLFIPRIFGSKSSGLKWRRQTLWVFRASFSVSSPNFGWLIARSHCLHRSTSLTDLGEEEEGGSDWRNSKKKKSRDTFLSLPVESCSQHFRMHLAVLLLASALPLATFALDNGEMRTPPMGWLAWERFRCDIDCEHDPKNCISENLFIDMADRLSEDGWRELGYVYVNIDDCWSSMKRDEKGRLQADPKRFPGGIRKLARYMHDRGLKLGLYGDMGTHTCGGYPGTTLDKIEIDAQTFADWEVDMFKFDGCYSNAVEQEKGYPLMSKALNATGRPIGYSCSWPAYQGGLPPKVNYTQLGEICNLWRNYGDIQDSWDSVLSIINWFFENQEVLVPAAGPGKWNDPDMLIAGDFGLSMEQSRAQMALWAIMAAPLFMSNDLRTIGSGARSILMNKVAISINQDPMGIQGRRIIKEKSGIDVYWRPLSKNASALVFFSRRTDMPYRYQTSLSKLNYTTGSYKIYDVFTDKTTTLKDSTSFVVSVNPTGVVMWHVSAPAKWNRRQFFKDGGLQGSAYDDAANGIPRGFL